MEVIKRIVSLENATSRDEGINYGVLTASSFYFKVELKQNIDDMGILTDFPYIASDPINYNLSQEEKNLRLIGSNNQQWFFNANKVSGVTDSKVDNLRSYNQDNPFIVGFDIDKENYINFSGATINGVSRVTNLSGESITYTYDANDDFLIGTNNQNTGILYSENLNNQNQTKFIFNSEGWNQTNASLSALIKEEYLFGIINKPEIINDIFIDRGNITVIEPHSKLCEVTSLDHLTRYGNGFYNIIK